MIEAHQVVDVLLGAAAKSGFAGDTIVLVTDRSEASLRWAGNSMTTNGSSVSRTTTVISIRWRGDDACVGSVQSSEVDPAVLTDLLEASQRAAQASPAARDSAPLLSGSDAPADWAAPVAGTGAEVFADIAGPLSSAFGGSDRLYGFAHHVLETTFVATSTGLRRRYTQPTGSVEINAKNDTGSAWVGVGTPDFVDVGIDGLLDELATRLSWSATTVTMPPGRYPTLLPPSTVADLMIYLTWTLDGRGAHEGRTALAAPGGGTRVGERLTHLPLTLYSDPTAAPLQCTPFVSAATSSERMSVFDNGMDIGRVDWLRDGHINALAYPRATAAQYDAPVAVPADNLLMTGGTASLHDMIASTERGLLLTTLWYIREVDPSSLLLTGLTRDGVYWIENGRVKAAVNNFRFNESPIDLLRRAIEAGASEQTLPREWADWATRTAMPPLRIPDFNMSSVSEAQ